MQRTDSLEKTLMLGKIKGRRRDDRGWDGWMASLINGREFEQTLGVGDGQGSLSGCSPWGCKESDMTEWLNWRDVKGSQKWANYLSSTTYMNEIFISKTLLLCESLPGGIKLKTCFLMEEMGPSYSQRAKTHSVLGHSCPRHGCLSPLLS